MNQIKYSIIIPHKDIVQLLVRCLKSIPDTEDFQVIVVDDNSKNVNQIISAINDLKRNNIELYLTKEGKGAGFARNEGLKHVKGRWCLFADADDFFADNFQQQLMDFSNSEFDIIYFTSCSVDNDTLVQVPSRDNTVKDCINRNKLPRLRFGHYVPWSKMIRTELIQRHNITFEETIVCNDAMFSITCGYYAHHILAVDKIIYVSTVRTNSLFFAISEERLQMRYDALVRRINVQLVKWGKWKYRQNIFHIVETFKQISESCYKQHLLRCLYDESIFWLVLDFILYQLKKIKKFL